MSKIDESYDTDRGRENLNTKDDINEFKTERKNYLPEIPSENSSLYTSTKVKINFIILIFFYRVMPQVQNQNHLQEMRKVIMVLTSSLV